MRDNESIKSHGDMCGVMANCKDCICYEKCKSSRLDFAESSEPTHICQYFKNKVDFAEVRHGEWLKQNGGFFFLCSDCYRPSATKTNYCHHCGTKMDQVIAE